MARMMSWRPVLVVLAVLGSTIALPCRAEETPPTLAGGKVVDAAEVQKLQAAGASIVDARIAAEYAEAHIKGSVNIVYHEKSAKSPSFDASQDDFSVAKLGADKAKSMVFYCNGSTCWKSYKAAVAAIKAGFTGVHWYRDGFADWKAKGLPSE